MPRGTRGVEDEGGRLGIQYVCADWESLHCYFKVFVGKLRAIWLPMSKV